jgi:hypothetical protein
MNIRTFHLTAKKNYIQMKTLKITFIFSFLTIMLACNQHKENNIPTEDKEEDVKFTPVTSDLFKDQFDENIQDSILLKIITYVYKAPEGISGLERFKPEHKAHYSKEIEKFTVVDYHIKEDKRHYFLLLRPARNIHGHKRTVGGSFLINEKNEISDYFEIFNTPILPAKEAVEKGKEILAYYQKNGDLGSYYLNKEYVEFPDERCVYSTDTYEWYYPKELDKVN